MLWVFQYQQKLTLCVASVIRNPTTAAIELDDTTFTTCHISGSPGYTNFCQIFSKCKFCRSLPECISPPLKNLRKFYNNADDICYDYYEFIFRWKKNLKVNQINLGTIPTKYKTCLISHIKYLSPPPICALPVITSIKGNKTNYFFIVEEKEEEIPE